MRSSTIFTRAVPRTASSGPSITVTARGRRSRRSIRYRTATSTYNHNMSHDRQIAGFGEATYKVTDRFAVTAGARYAKLGFSLNHYSNGYENYGPANNYGPLYAQGPPIGGSESENAFTPKVGRDLPGGRQEFVLRDLRQGLPPGRLQCALAAGVLRPGPGRRRLSRVAESPPTYNNDTTQSYEIGAKNNFETGSRSRPASTTSSGTTFSRTSMLLGNCGLQFTDNLGTAVAKGFDMQAEADIGGGLSVEASVGYTARASPRPRPAIARSTAMRSQAKRRSTTAPARTRPGRSQSGRNTPFTPWSTMPSCAPTGNTTSRNPWLAPVQDPTQQSVQPELVHAARDQLHLGARRREVGRLAGLGVLRQSVRLAHAASTTRRCRSTRSIRAISRNPPPRTIGATERFHLPPAHLRHHGDAPKL